VYPSATAHATTQAPLRHPAATPTLRRTAHRSAPAIVDTRQRVGDWEGDTIVGKGLARIVTLVERKTGLLRMRRVANGESDPTMRAIVHAVYPVSARVHTLTWDNGGEFAEHALIDIALDATSYFAEPYSAWQCGSNENTNGLLRQYFPKGCDLGAFTDAQIQQIGDKLNRRPRKRLRYRTPQHVFDISFKRDALRS
jgi:IS30 family transposase